MSGRRSFATASAAAPLSAGATAKPLSRSAAASSSRMFGSSSTTSTRARSSESTLNRVDDEPVRLLGATWEGLAHLGDTEDLVAGELRGHQQALRPADDPAPQPRARRVDEPAHLLAHPAALH